MWYACNDALAGGPRHICQLCARLSALPESAAALHVRTLLLTECRARCMQHGDGRKLQKISSAERRRLNEKYGVLQRVDSFGPQVDYTSYDSWELI